ncbi:MAG: hypothetical protein KKB20_26220 [Proteobacteria bacterium]|nr:hypothetical protein [Pseudomonadota bacterium]
MSRNFFSTYNVLAVSAAHSEDRINEPLAPDTALLAGAADVINLESRRETNAEEATGKEEPDVIYDLGGLAAATFNFDKCQAQHAAFLLAFALGSVSTAGAGGSGYLHSITPISGDLDEARSNPSFTAVQRLGSSVAKRLFASCFVDQATLTAAADSWLKIAGTIKGTGYTQGNVKTDQVAGYEDDASVTLSLNAVQGADAAARLESIHYARFKAVGDAHWQYASVTAVSGDTPAVLTVTPLSASHDAGTWDIGYVPDEETSLVASTATSDPPNDTTGVFTDSGVTMVVDEHIGRWLVILSGTASGRIWKITDNTVTTLTCSGINLYAAGVRSGDSYKVVQFGWLPLPARVSEPPLRVSGVYLHLGGAWNGSAFQGGYQLAAPLKELVWTFNNNLTPQFTPGSGTDAFADRALRSGRGQTLTLDKDCRDWLLQQRLADNETFGIHLLCEGPEYEAGHKYQIEVVFPKVGLLSAEVGEADGRLSEKAEVVILEDDAYGSVIARVKNQQSGYAA